MAKVKVEDTSSEVVDETVVVEGAGSGVNVIEFADGSKRDFGKKGQIQKEITITSDTITIKFWLVSGAMQELVFPKTNQLYDTMAARGLIEFVGNSIAGVYQDKEGLHPADLDFGVEKAINNLLSGVIPTRTRGETESLKGMGDLIRAYSELRASFTDAEGNRVFSDEECSLAAVRALILASDDTTNKQRLAQASVKAKIEEYKLERQIAKAALAKSKVEGVAQLV